MSHARHQPHNLPTYGMGTRMVKEKFNILKTSTLSPRVLYPAQVHPRAAEVVPYVTDTGIFL